MNEAMKDIAELTPAAILAAIIFSILGGLVIKQGRLKKSVELYFIGFAMMGYGYIVYDPVLTWIIGVALTVMALKFMQDPG